MLLICGTIPQDNFSIITGKAEFQGDRLLVENTEISCTQGTAALISAACLTAQFLNSSLPQVVLAGDTGKGTGSNLLYNYLINNLPGLNPDVLLMHYILPIMGQMKKVVATAAKCGKKPVLMADASSMYAAKGAGLAPEFDVFTPDICELAFLADPDAIHPAYIQYHLFSADDSQAPDLIEAAYKQKGAAKILIAKGATDYVAEKGKIVAEINEPDIPAMEAIGGTGDTISGLTGAMIDAGFNPRNAAVNALRTNRKAGACCEATPATKIRLIVEAIPKALKSIL